MTPKAKIKIVMKLINEVGKLKANTEITGVYLDNTCITQFAITLYDVIEAIERDNSIKL